MNIEIFGHAFVLRISWGNLILVDCFLLSTFALPFSVLSSCLISLLVVTNLIYCSTFFILINQIMLLGIMQSSFKGMEKIQEALENRHIQQLLSWNLALLGWNHSSIACIYVELQKQSILTAKVSSMVAEHGLQLPAILSPAQTTPSTRLSVNTTDNLLSCSRFCVLPSMWIVSLMPTQPLP